MSYFVDIDAVRPGDFGGLITVPSYPTYALEQLIISNFRLDSKFIERLRNMLKLKILSVDSPIIQPGSNWKKATLWLQLQTFSCVLPSFVRNTSHSTDNDASAEWLYFIYCVLQSQPKQIIIKDEGLLFNDEIYNKLQINNENKDLALSNVEVCFVFFLCVFLFSISYLYSHTYNVSRATNQTKHVRHNNYI